MGRRRHCVTGITLNGKCCIVYIYTMYIVLAVYCYNHKMGHEEDELMHI